MRVQCNSVVYRAGRPPRDILHEVSLLTPERGTVAVVGPSGSGKTTLLCLLGGLLTPTSGRVTWSRADGSPLSRRRAREDIRWMFQHQTLLGGRPALDNVLIGRPPIAGMPRQAREGQARQALEDVGLLDRADSLVDQLSGGEQQRVAIARVMFAAPTLVLADEPTGQLDRTTSSQVVDALVNAVPPDTTLIAATHDLGVAARFDQVWEVIDGELAL